MADCGEIELYLYSFIPISHLQRRHPGLPYGRQLFSKLWSNLQMIP